MIRSEHRGLPSGSVLVTGPVSGPRCSLRRKDAPQSGPPAGLPPATSYPLGGRRARGTKEEPGAAVHRVLVPLALRPQAEGGTEFPE